MKRNLIVGAIAALFVNAACALEPFTVKDIRVEGIQRTEAGTVFSYLPVKVGDTMTDEKAAQAAAAETKRLRNKLDAAEFFAQAAHDAEAERALAENEKLRRELAALERKLAIRERLQTAANAE